MREQRTQLITFYKAEASQRNQTDLGEVIDGANQIFAPAKLSIEQSGTMGTIQIPSDVIGPDQVDTICALARSPGIAAIFVPAISLNKGYVVNGLSAHDNKAFLIADALGADGPGLLTRGDKFVRAFCHELAHCLRRDDKEYYKPEARGTLLLYYTTDNGRGLTADDIEKINPAR
jgi:hypothetical protein